MDIAAFKNGKSVFKRCLSRILHPRISLKPHTDARPQPTRVSSPAVEAAQFSKESKDISWIISTSASGPTPVFHYFTLLPAELRLQIWEIALFGTPRTVEFIEVLNTEPSAPLSPGVPRSFDHLLLSTPVPTSLQICRETRTFALSRYIFSTGNIKLYLDPKIDTLCFGKLACSTTLQILMLCAQEVDLRRLQKLIIEERFLDTLGRPVRMMEEALQRSNRSQWMSHLDVNRSADMGNTDIREKSLFATSGDGAKSCEKPFKLLSGLSDRKSVV